VDWMLSFPDKMLKYPYNLLWEKHIVTFKNGTSNLSYAQAQKFKIELLLTIMYIYY
jgi:hypothetical protein